MVFSSAIFLFAFLPIVFALYMVAPSIRVKNALLTVASLLFYAFGEPLYVFLMIGTTIINYIFGRLLGKGSLHRDNFKLYRKIILLFAIILNIGMLGVFKYTGFMISSLNAGFHLDWNVPEIILPIGISFFTFQALSYVVDVYRDASLEQKSFPDLLLYISFFPQLIAGPIIRYHDVDQQIQYRTVDVERICEGIQRFIKGMAKKLILANGMGYIADAVFALDIKGYSFFVAWLGAICYALQIYYDFSGYSDMAIGLASMFGFRFKENFEHPYSSGSIKEFWRRWHISLSSWFKEYVYIPLGGNRKSKLRTECNKMTVFLLTGIWHGANWTFVLWGVLHGIANILEDTILPIHKIKSKVIKNVYTWILVITAFVMFRADTVSYGLQVWKTMFSNFSVNAASVSFFLEYCTPYNVFILLSGILFSYPVSAKCDGFLKKKCKHYQIFYYVGSIVLLLLCILNLASASYNPFIYFRF